MEVYSSARLLARSGSPTRCWSRLTRSTAASSSALSSGPASCCRRGRPWRSSTARVVWPAVHSSERIRGLASTSKGVARWSSRQSGRAAVPISKLVSTPTPHQHKTGGSLRDAASALCGSDSKASQAVPSTMANETIQANDGGKEPKQQLNIAFLECDEPAEPTLRKHGGFHDMLHKLLEPLMDIEHGHIKLKVHAFDPVYKRQYPTREQLEHVDCVCISGSFVEYAGVDTPWITRLLGYVIYLHDEFPRIRLIGICFGHQIIARAFGARVETEGYGWEIGSTPLYLTDEGKKLLCPPKDQRDVLRIQQMHSDVITNVPEGFKLLAWSDKTPVQSLVKYYDKNQLDEMEDPPEYVHGERRPPKPYSMIHILTCQGHAEWGPEVIDPLVDEFLKDGKITEEIAKEAKSKTKEKDDAEMFARAFLRQMGLILQDTKKQIEQQNGH